MHVFSPFFFERKFAKTLDDKPRSCLDCNCLEASTHSHRDRSRLGPQLQSHWSHREVSSMTECCALTIPMKFTDVNFRSCMHRSLHTHKKYSKRESSWTLKLTTQVRGTACSLIHRQHYTVWLTMSAGALHNFSAICAASTDPPTPSCAAQTWLARPREAGPDATPRPWGRVIRTVPSDCQGWQEEEEERKAFGRSTSCLAA